MQSRWTTGQAVCLVSASSTSLSAESSWSMSLVLEVVGNGLVLAPVAEPYHRLHLMAKEVCFKSATPNRDNILSLEELSEDTDKKQGDSLVYLISRASDNSNSKAQSKASAQSSHGRQCLGLTAEGRLVVVNVQSSNRYDSLYDETHGCVQVRWHVKSDAAASSTDRTKTTLPIPRPVANLTEYKSRRLQLWQMRRFVTEGYLHLSQVIPQERVDHCAAYLMHHMGQVGCLIAGGVQGKNYGKFPGQVSNSDLIRNMILSTGVEDIVRELFGQEIWNRKNISAQIAFRYPQFRNDTNDSGAVDNAEDIEWHTDGYRQGSSHAFSILLGVSLSALEQDFEGNLCVWPASHFLLHRYRKGVYGGLDLRQLLEQTSNPESPYNEFFHPSQREFGHSQADADGNSAAGNPPAPADTENKDDYDVKEHDNSSSILPCLGTPLQVRTRPGDIVLLHPDLAHGGAPNYSCHIRQMMYFRLRVDHGPDKVFSSWNHVVEAQTEDLWADYLGLQNSLGRDRLQALGNAFL